MTSNIPLNFPKEMLTHIFSFLEPEELACAAKVSSWWNEVQQVKELWKRHCLDYLDDTELHQDSWKEQFKVLKNWMKNERTEKTSFSTNRSEDFHNFTILENNTPIEVCFDDFSSTYFIHDLANDKTTPIDNVKFKDDAIISSTIHDKTWVALTKQGRILFFELPTGQYLKEIIPSDPIKISTSAIIKCDDQEVITAYNKEIKILDINKSILKSIDTSKLGEIRTLNSTPNFIIFTIKTDDYSDTLNTYSICKNDPKKIEEDPSATYAVTDSGPYLAMLYQNGTITIFKDTGKSLSLIHTVKLFSYNIYKGPIHMHKNWLLVSQEHNLKIYDGKTGEELSTIERYKKYTALYSNATQLLARSRSPHSLAYKYTLYDFKPLTNAPSTSSEIPAKKKCIIQ